MRIALSAETNNGLDSTTSQHFGRCPYFIFVDLDGNNVKGVSGVVNPFFKNREPGQVPTFIWEHGTDVMLTRGMGYRAMDFFQQMGIQYVTGTGETVRQSLEHYLNGKLVDKVMKSLSWKSPRLCVWSMRSIIGGSSARRVNFRTSPPIIEMIHG